MVVLKMVVYYLSALYNLGYLGCERVAVRVFEHVPWCIGLRAAPQHYSSSNTKLLGFVTHADNYGFKRGVTFNKIERCVEKVLRRAYPPRNQRGHTVELTEVFVLNHTQTPHKENLTVNRSLPQPRCQLVEFLSGIIHVIVQVKEGLLEI